MQFFCGNYGILSAKNYAFFWNKWKKNHECSINGSIENTGLDTAPEA
jgi:hypothetical protein